MDNIPLQERLIVAADFNPRPEMGKAWADVESQVLSLASSLQGTGVCLKVNSVLRACGYGLVNKIRSYGLKVFFDLKLCDIPNTLETDGILLVEAKPDILTVMCSAGRKAIRKLKDQLPNTEILGVTVLTSMDDQESEIVFGQPVALAVKKLAENAFQSDGLNGWVAAPTEIGILNGVREYYRLHSLLEVLPTINTPNIRPVWAKVKGDDQNKNRSMTPAEAFLAGADRIVVGRPINQSSDPPGAVEKTLEEIDKSLAAKAAKA